MAARGWWLVAWTALLVGLGVVGILVVQGTGPEGIGAWLRWTARVSGLLFYAALSASALHAFRDIAATRTLLANRRYVGVSAAVAHTWHLAGIAAYAQLPDVQIGAGSAVPGGLAYLFLLAMVATSFDRTAAWLGARSWKRLHTIGAWYVWFVFTYTFLGSASAHLASAAMAVLGFGVLGLRVALARRRVRAAHPAAAVQGGGGAAGA